MSFSSSASGSGWVVPESSYTLVFVVLVLVVLALVPVALRLVLPVLRESQITNRYELNIPRPISMSNGTRSIIDSRVDIRPVLPRRPVARQSARVLVLVVVPVPVAVVVLVPVGSCARSSAAVSSSPAAPSPRPVGALIDETGSSRTVLVCGTSSVRAVTPLWTRPGAVCVCCAGSSSSVGGGGACSGSGSGSSYCCSSLSSSSLSSSSSCSVAGYVDELLLVY